jgi:maleate cis-trans isomerase
MADKWEKVIPKRVFGMLAPLAKIEYEAMVFYRMAPPDVMSIYIPIGLQEFTVKDVNRVFEPLDGLIDQLLERDVDLILQGGVPLPLVTGVKAHDKLLDHIAKRSGLPVSSSVTAVTAAAKHLGLKKIVTCNKWSAEMNKVLVEFFARDGVTVIGSASEPMAPVNFLKMDTRAGLELAYELGRRAILEHPDCDGLYCGGGAWLIQPAMEALEKEFGIPCISNQDSQLWHELTLTDYWKPRPGFSRLLASA